MRIYTLTLNPATVCGENSEGRLAAAVAFGTAACLTEGTQPPTEEMIRNLLLQIHVL